MIADDRFPWVPYYPAKLLGALDGMPSDQKLVYQIVLLRIYDSGGPLKDTVDVIARRCGINKRRASDALDALFKAGKLLREGDGIINGFAREVLAEAEALRERRASAGQKGATRRWRKDKGNQRTPHGKPNAQAMANDGQLQLQVQEEPTPTGVGAAPQVARKTFLPETWTPDAEDIAHATNLGFDLDDVAKNLAPAFKDHHRARGNRMVTWKAAWRTWVRNEVAFRARRRGVQTVQKGGRDERPDRTATTAGGKLVEGLRSGAVQLAPEPARPGNVLRGEGDAPPRLLPPK